MRSTFPGPRTHADVVRLSAPVSRRTRMTAALLVFLSLVVASLGTHVQPAAAVSPLILDDFGGSQQGIRTITELPAAGSGGTGRFEQADGYGTVTAETSDSAGTGVRLDYDLGAVDLTSNGDNSRLVVQIASARRTPTEPGSSAAMVQVEATDAAGVTGSYQMSVGNAFGVNLDVALSCSETSICLSPQPDVTAITHLRLQVEAPSTGGASTTSVSIDAVRIVPGNAQTPEPPTVSISADDGPIYGTTGDSIDFLVRFRSGGDPVPVTRTSGTDDGLLAADLDAGGSAGAGAGIDVSGGPHTYRVRVGPLTDSGMVTLRVPRGVVADAWGQPNDASDVASTAFVIAERPVFVSDALPAGLVGSGYEFQFAAPAAPDAEFTVTSGGLPPGLGLTNTGLLRGTPRRGGAYA